MASLALFDRKWELVFDVMDDSSGALKSTGKTATITDLKVTFNIKNTALGDPSLATFQVYNISKATQDIISSYGCHVSLKTGYFSEDSASWDLLFEGEVTNSYPIRQGADHIYNVWARNSFKLLTKTSPKDISFAVPTPIKTIVNSLLASTTLLSNLPTYKCGTEAIIDALASEEEYVATGTYTEEFDSLLCSNGIGWYVKETTLILYNQEDPTPLDSEGDGLKISRETGLMTVPVVDYRGITFTNLLNGKIVPLGIISVEPNTAKYNLGNEFYVEKYDMTKWSAKGTFRVYEVTHKGDTRGDSWTSDVLAFYRST